MCEEAKNFVEDEYSVVQMQKKTLVLKGLEWPDKAELERFENERERLEAMASQLAEYYKSYITICYKGARLESREYKRMKFKLDLFTDRTFLT
jgi:hypothetical protein